MSLVPLGVQLFTSAGLESRLPALPLLQSTMPLSSSWLAGQAAPAPAKIRLAGGLAKTASRTARRQTGGELLVLRTQILRSIAVAQQVVQPLHTV